MMLGPCWVLGNDKGQADTVLVITGLLHFGLGSPTLTKEIHRQEYSAGK